MMPILFSQNYLFKITYLFKFFHHHSLNESINFSDENLSSTQRDLNEREVE